MKRNHPLLSFFFILVSFLWVGIIGISVFDGYKVRSGSVIEMFMFGDISGKEDILSRIFYQSGTILPLILLFFSVVFGIKYFKSENTTRGYRLLNISTITFSILILIILTVVNIWAFVNIN